jgi:hypothetical protein
VTASAVTRVHSIAYGALTVGGGTHYHLHGAIVRTSDYTQLTLSFFVVVQESTESTFAARAAALEAAFRAPNANLVMTTGAGSETWSHSANTGMGAIPHCRKAGSSLDSATSRLYECSVTVQLPADEPGKSGRQSARVTYSEDGSEIMHMAVSAVYTALGANSALAQAQSAFPTYYAALQTAAGGTWDEYGGRVYTPDDEGKICQASAAFRRVISNQSVAALNDTTLQDVQISVSTKTVAPGDAAGSGAQRMQQITVVYSARVRSSVSTDLQSVWLTKVRPRMVAVATALSDARRVTAISVEPGLDAQNNAISARMVFLAAPTSVISVDLVVSTTETLPFTLEPVLTGDPYARDRHWAVGDRRATVVALILEVDDGRGAGREVYDAAIRDLEGEGYLVRRVSTPALRKFRLGARGVGAPLTLRSTRLQTELEFATVVGGDAKGGGNRHQRAQVRR